MGCAVVQFGVDFSLDKQHAHGIDGQNRNR